MTAETCRSSLVCERIHYTGRYDILKVSYCMCWWAPSAVILTSLRCPWNKLIPVSYFLLKVKMCWETGNQFGLFELLSLNSKKRKNKHNFSPQKISDRLFHLWTAYRQTLVIRLKNPLSNCLIKMLGAVKYVCGYDSTGSSHGVSCWAVKEYCLPTTLIFFLSCDFATQGGGGVALWQTQRTTDG